MLAAGGGARASHRAAARLLGIATYEGAPLELTVPSKRKFARPGVIVHESRDLAYVPPIHIDGIPCTPPRRLAVDIGWKVLRFDEEEVMYAPGGVLHEVRRTLEHLGGWTGRC